MSDRYYEGDRIYFRAIEPQDEPMVRRWLHDPQTRATLARVLPISRAAEREWIDGLYRDGGVVGFLIVLREGDRAIGSVGLHDVHAINRSATFGILIGEKDLRGRGYGTEATRLMLKFAFEELNLNRVGLGVFSTNKAGIRAYERAGFVREGCFRQACFRGGRYVDELRYAILREDWALKNPLPGTQPRSAVARCLLKVPARAQVDVA